MSAEVYPFPPRNCHHGEFPRCARAVDNEDIPLEWLPNLDIDGSRKWDGNSSLSKRMSPLSVGTSIHCACRRRCALSRSHGQTRRTVVTLHHLTGSAESRIQWNRKVHVCPPLHENSWLTFFCELDNSFKGDVECADEGCCRKVCIWSIFRYEFIY